VPAPVRAREVAMIDRTTVAGQATVKQPCALFGISRHAYYAAGKEPVAVPARREPRPRRPRGVSLRELRSLIAVVIVAQPDWGHRKVWATLRRNGTFVSRRRVAEVMRANGDMQVPRERRGPPRRAGKVVVPEPNRRFATDLTTVWARLDGVVAVALTVAGGCRNVLEVTATRSQAAPSVLASVERALEAAFGDAQRVTWTHADLNRVGRILRVARSTGWSVHEVELALRNRST
jgi:transposase InsO family protein